MKTGLIVTAALSTVFVGAAAIGSLTTSSQPSVTPSLATTCQSAVASRERDNYAHFQIDNTVANTDGTVSVFYQADHGEGFKERLIARCSGSATSPDVELVSVDAKRLAL